MSPVSTRICVPNLVAVRRSCRKKGGVQTDRQTDRQRKLQLYIVDNKKVNNDNTIKWKRICWKLSSCGKIMCPHIEVSR